MNLKDMLPNAVKTALFTEDTPPAATPIPVAISLPVQPMQVASPFASISPIAGGASPSPATDILGGSDSESLAKFTSLLRSRTDFDSTPIGLQLQEHIEPLTGLPLTEEQKITTALKAGAKDGLTGEAILSEYERLVALLHEEQHQFDRSVAATTKTEVDDCKAAIVAEAGRIKDLEAQITAAREHQSQMSSDMIAAQTRIEQRKAQFAAAFAARQAELQSAIHRYQFLKGSTAHVDQPVNA